MYGTATPAAFNKPLANVGVEPIFGPHELPLMGLNWPFNPWPYSF